MGISLCRVSLATWTHDGWRQEGQSGRSAHAPITDVSWMVHGFHEAFGHHLFSSLSMHLKFEIELYLVKNYEKPVKAGFWTFAVMDGEQGHHVCWEATALELSVKRCRAAGHSERWQQWGGLVNHEVRSSIVHTMHISLLCWQLNQSFNQSTTAVTHWHWQWKYNVVQYLGILTCK